MDMTDDVEMQFPHPKETARAQELYTQGHRAKIRQIPAEDVFLPVTQYAFLRQNGEVYVWNEGASMPFFAESFLAPTGPSGHGLSAWVIFRELLELGS